MENIQFWKSDITAIFLKLKTKKHIRDTNPHAKFGKDVSRAVCGRSPKYILGYTLFLFFVFELFAQRPCRTARRTATNEGSNGVFPAKEVPFAGS